jgi:hypothetical protein
MNHTWNEFYFHKPFLRHQKVQLRPRRNLLHNPTPQRFALTVQLASLSRRQVFAAGVLFGSIVGQVLLVLGRLS